MPLLPAVWGWLAGLLVVVVGPIVGRVLMALGIGFVSYTGSDLLMTAIQTAITTNVGSLPAAASQWLGLFKIGTCINIMFSAISIRAALAGFSAGSATKMVIKP